VELNLTKRNDLAMEIAQNLLDKSGAALASGEFEDFLACMIVPHSVETFDGLQIIETEEDLQGVFEGVRDQLNRLGVVEPVRHILDASFNADGTISCTHETRLVANNQLVQAPFPVFSQLRKERNEWKIASGLYAIDDKSKAAASFQGAALKSKRSDQS